MPENVPIEHSHPLDQEEESARGAPSSTVIAPLETLKYYRSEIKHEFALLSNRVSSYATSQSFLIIAFASSMGNTNPKWGALFTLIFPLGLAVLGIVTSLRSQEGIDAAIETIELWHVKQNQLFENNPALDAYRLERSHSGTAPTDSVHRRSLTFARLSPRAFLVAWCVFGAMVVFLHFK